MLDLRTVTLWACVWSPSEEWIDRTFRVVRYCTRIAKFGDVIFFSYRDPRILPACGWKVVMIPKLDLQGWNLFVNREVPKYITTPFCLSVHEDGFIVDPSMWTDDFLRYDYIGAPWPDGVVGNQGFCIESKKLLEVKRRLPHLRNDADIPSDVFVCRKHRSRLERAGVTFAPTALAERFSTEMYGDDRPSFGFHGRTHAHRKYPLGWQQIAAMEASS